MNKCNYFAVNTNESSMRGSGTSWAHVRQRSGGEMNRRMCVKTHKNRDPAIHAPLLRPVTWCAGVARHGKVRPLLEESSNSPTGRRRDSKSSAGHLRGRAPWPRAGRATGPAFLSPPRSEPAGRSLLLRGHRAAEVAHGSLLPCPLGLQTRRGLGPSHSPSSWSPPSLAFASCPRIVALRRLCPVLSHLLRSGVHALLSARRPSASKPSGHSPPLPCIRTHPLAHRTLIPLRDTYLMRAAEPRCHARHRAVFIYSGQHRTCTRRRTHARTHTASHGATAPWH